MNKKKVLSLALILTFVLSVTVFADIQKLI